MPISLEDTETSYQSCIQVWRHDFSLFVFGKAKEKALNGNWEQIYRAFVHFACLKTYPLGLWYVNRLNAFEWVLNTPWMLLSAREYLWVLVNSPWTPIECAWMPMSECEQPLNNIECAWMPLSASDRHWVIIDCDSPGGSMRKNIFVWYLNIPFMQLSVCECLWVSI